MVRRAVLRCTALALIAFVLVSVGRSGAARAQFLPGGVMLCSDVFYQGRCQVFFSDVPDLGGTFVEHESARSLRVFPGWAVSVYRESFFSGRCQTFFQDAPVLDGTFIGAGTINSLRVNVPCPPQQAAPLPPIFAPQPPIQQPYPPILPPTPPLPPIPPPAPLPLPIPAPAAPTGLHVSDTGRHHVSFEWDVTPNAAGYWVFAPYPNNAQSQEDEAAYSLENLTPGGYYCLTVIAFNASGFSSWSSWVCANTMP